LTKIIYPHTRTVDQVDELHGVRVADPYRWLEDSDSAEAKEWIAAQNTLTFDFLEEVPAREQIGKRLTQLWDYARAWAPVKRRGRYFQARNSGLQNQNVLYVQDELGNGQKSEARLLLDPNTLSTDGTVALNSWAVSEDGNWLAYAASASGSDWQSWRIRDVRTGEDLPDLIEWSKFSGAAWRKDGSGFYYARYDAPESGKDYSDVNYYQKVYFHKLGETQAQDQLVYERPDQKEWGFGASVSEDGRYLIIAVWQGTDVRNRVFYQD
jgi:prolyl oligopeptidase